LREGLEGTIRVLLVSKVRGLAGLRNYEFQTLLHRHRTHRQLIALSSGFHYIS
jgi:hypothetical protein